MNDDFMRCPHCNCPISKVDGCWKMTCGLCKGSFNWQLTYEDVADRRFDVNSPDLPSLFYLWKTGDVALFNKMMSYISVHYYQETLEGDYLVRFIVLLFFWPLISVAHAVMWIIIKQKNCFVCVPCIAIALVPLSFVTYVLMMVSFPFCILVNLRCCKKSKAIQKYTMFLQNLKKLGIKRKYPK